MTNDCICLSIPSKVEYISTARLATSGIASKMNLTIDDIEDIKLCVGEACIYALKANKEGEISIKYEIKEDRMIISIGNVDELLTEKPSQSNEDELGLLIIKSLMDEVKFSDKRIEMIKYK